MSLKKLYTDYFTFSKKDRIAVFIFLLFLLLIYLLPRLWPKSGSTGYLQRDTTLNNIMDTLQIKRSQSSNRFSEDNKAEAYEYEPSQSNTYVANGELFTFDPNLLPINDWKRLGLNDRTIKTITNYRTKGGKFYKPEDLKKIWGMPEGFYERVKNYIQITSVQKNSNYKFPDAARTYEKRERSISIIEVNEADTAAFIALPGIGSKLAYRITNFRDKLGGFYSADQIGETYGLPDSTFQKIKPYLNADASAVRKININTTSKEELKVHPYIRWNLANAIVEYRTQHGGRFSSLDDLKNIVLIDEATFDKIVPYLTL